MTVNGGSEGVSTVRALLCHGPAQTSWNTVPDPAIEEATDAIVRVDATIVCGSDLHILRGDLPDVKPGTVLGHEAVGGRGLSIVHEAVNRHAASTRATADAIT